MNLSTTSALRLTEPQDVAFFEHELESFLPDKIYDAHCHVWHRDHAIKPAEIPPIVGHAEYLEMMKDIHGGRRTGAMFIPSPSNTENSMMAAANAWTAQACGADPDFRGLFFVKPENDAEWVRDQVRQLGLNGLKCYHTAAPVKPTWEAQIPDYLPESFLQVADDEGWVITLHMVRSRACADPSNIHWIRYYCETYPNMKLILAHSARGFQPAHNLEGLPQLTGLDNLYFDTSANCDAMAHQSIIRIIGHDKLMYGSDLPVCHLRGRSVPAADSFIWLYRDTPVWGEKHTQIKPLLVGLEHLRSLKWACWSERLTDSQVEDIFYNNAVHLLGV